MVNKNTYRWEKINNQYCLRWLRNNIENGNLRIVHSGNGDYSWIYYDGKRSKQKELIIDKSANYFYEWLDKLYRDITDGTYFKAEDSVVYFSRDDYININEILRSELLVPKTNILKYVSDNSREKELLIIPRENAFSLIFINDKDSVLIAIEFVTSGSRYEYAQNMGVDSYALIKAKVK